MTPYCEIYKAFMSRVLEDEWENWLIEEAEADWETLLDAAIPWFKFPRVSLERDRGVFVETLGNAEIQVLANYMKCEWLNRCIMTWENIKPQYQERDFSQANLLDKLNATLKQERTYAEKFESIYYRSRNGKPFNFSRLATKGSK